MASTFIAVLLFGLAVYYLIWGGRQHRVYIAKEDKAKKLEEEIAYQEYVTFRYNIASQKIGYLLVDSAIIYRSKQGDEKEIDLSDIILFAEYISDDDLWATQYHTYVVIDKTGNVSNWNAGYFAPETIEKITAALGTRRTESLALRIEMTSRIMYPIELWGHNLYDAILSVSAKNWVYTQEVNEYLTKMSAGRRNP